MGMWRLLVVGGRYCDVKISGREEGEREGEEEERRGSLMFPPNLDTYL